MNPILEFWERLGLSFATMWLCSYKREADRSEAAKAEARRQAQ